MPVVTSAVWILFGLATTVWAADWNGSKTVGLCAFGGLALGGVFAARTGGPRPEVAGLAVAMLALAQATRRRYVWIGPVLAGALTGSWCVHLVDAGAAPWLALPLAMAGPLVSAWRVHADPRFVETRIRDEALLLLSAVGLVVATLPTIVEGWQSAATLAAAPADQATRQAIPIWTTVTVIMALSLGGLHAAWRRR